MLVPAIVLDALSPHMRVITAAAPFALAMAVRLLLGGNSFTRWLITIGVVWFAANVLMAPYGLHMRQNILYLRFLLL